MCIVKIKCKKTLLQFFSVHISQILSLFSNLQSCDHELYVYVVYHCTTSLWAARLLHLHIPSTVLNAGKHQDGCLIIIYEGTGVENLFGGDFVVIR